MDRRQQKTRDAIFKAFSVLLQKRRYEHITVQEIIDEANIGRSTFYAHFETKDHLLKALCSNIFDHIFDNDICEYPSDTSDLESKLAHILWHLKNGPTPLSGILTAESGDLFMRYLKEYLTIFFRIYLSNFHADVPQDFFLNHLVGSFSETVKWWVKNGMEPSPEQTAKYFMAATETH